MPRLRFLARPWRSAVVGWAVTAVALVASVPLFLRMPPWCDLTLYDAAARNLLAGGVHYRDVFDTNLPGFVWALAAVRAALGWSTEAVRAADLAVVVAIWAVLDRLAARGGADPAGRAWAATAAALFYPYLSEFNHGQRDVWMLLPAAVAVTLRVRRTTDGGPGRGTGRAVGLAAVEGGLWGLAVWVKPHVVVPAAAVWLATAPGLARAGGWRLAAADLLGNVVGGLLVGAAGVAYLAASGTWPHFVEVFTFWNAGYAAVMWEELPTRVAFQLEYFPPWSLLPVLAVPVAGLAVIDGLGGRHPGPVGRLLPAWLWDAGRDDAVRSARLTLAALYLGWTLQAVLVQRAFHYVHVPEVLLLLAVLAQQRWAAGFAVAAYLAVAAAWAAGSGSVVSSDAVGWPAAAADRWLVRHPLADPDRTARWADCFRFGLPPAADRERMTAVGQVKGFHAANDWVQLGEVSDWLAARGATAADVVCWHDAPHAAYLALPGRPGFRFMHVSQMAGIGPAQDDRLRAELSAALARRPPPRWAVSDLWRPGAEDPAWTPPEGAGPDLLPPTWPADVKADFPFAYPAVFRSGGGLGRYAIHDLTRPPNGVGE